MYGTGASQNYAMSGTDSSRLRILKLFAAIMVCSVAASACNIPVFRFALERWKPDACEIVVFYEQPMSADDEQTMQNLERASQSHGGHANLNVIRCDVSANEDPELQNLWVSTKEKTGLALPVVVARSLKGRGKTINHWHGSVADLREVGMLNSPARTELMNRLQNGDAVVWLILKSADEEKTQAVRNLLQKQCDALPRELELPEGIGLPGSELYSEVPLLLQFSVLEIDPKDPNEQYLVKQLSGFHPDAVTAGETLAVPVFGRGRALEVIPAPQLDADLIHDLTEFLCGACSCQVKEQNPGFDLLLSTDWNLTLFGENSEGPPPEASAGAGRKQGAELVPIPTGKGKK